MFKKVRSRKGAWTATIIYGAIKLLTVVIALVVMYNLFYKPVLSNEAKENFDSNQQAVTSFIEETMNRVNGNND